MEFHGLKTRPAKCAGRWYPYEKQSHRLTDNPVSTAVISPHAGFTYSGMVSLEAVAHVKKNRVWFFGTSHYELPRNGLSIYFGDYSSSIGKALFPCELSEKGYNSIKKYLSDEGHRTEEHSIENVLYCLNHFKAGVEAFCGLVYINCEEDFESISSDIAQAWKKGDSIAVSTDWNHFVSNEIMRDLLKDVSVYLGKGDIASLYRLCIEGKQEACGIDGLYLAHKILSKVNENTKFKVFTVTDSSESESRIMALTRGSCVGYISAGN